MQYYKIKRDSPELRHHGVKGMHWGVTREKDQPSGKHHSKSDTKEIDKQRKREEKARKFEKKAKRQWDPEKRDMYLREAKRARDGKLSKRQRQLILGAALVAAYATYKFVDSGESHRLIDNGRAYLNGKGIHQWARNEALADKSLNKEEIMSKVVSRINDDYGKPGTVKNCRRCTFAYVQSRRGFDVSATKSTGATGQDGFGLYNAITDKHKIKGGIIGGFREAYKNEDGDFMQFIQGKKKDINSAIDLGQNRTAQKTSEAIFETLSKLPDRSCGELAMKWDVGGGHSMAWEIIHGKPVVIDCQSRTMYDNPEAIKDLAERMKEASYTRLDNLQFDPVTMGRWLKNAVVK